MIQWHLTQLQNITDGGLCLTQKLDHACIGRISKKHQGHSESPKEFGNGLT